MFFESGAASFGRNLIVPLRPFLPPAGFCVSRSRIELALAGLVLLLEVARDRALRLAGDQARERAIADRAVQRRDRALRSGRSAGEPAGGLVLRLRGGQALVHWLRGDHTGGFRRCPKVCPRACRRVRSCPVSSCRASPRPSSSPPCSCRASSRRRAASDLASPQKKDDRDAARLERRELVAEVARAVPLHRGHRRRAGIHGGHHRLLLRDGRHARARSALHARPARNPLVRFLPALRRVNGSARTPVSGRRSSPPGGAPRSCARSGARRIASATASISAPPWPSRRRTACSALGQFAYYDAAVVHGFEGMRSVRERRSRAPPPRPRAATRPPTSRRSSTSASSRCARRPRTRTSRGSRPPSAASCARATSTLRRRCAGRSTGALRVLELLRSAREIARPPRSRLQPLLDLADVAARRLVPPAAREPRADRAPEVAAPITLAVPA